MKEIEEIIDVIRKMMFWIDPCDYDISKATEAIYKLTALETKLKGKRLVSDEEIQKVKDALRLVYVSEITGKKDVVRLLDSMGG